MSQIQDLRDVVQSEPTRADEDMAQEPDSSQLNAVDGGIRSLGFGHPTIADGTTGTLPPWSSDDAARVRKALASVGCSGRVGDAVEWHFTIEGHRAPTARSDEVASSLT